MPYRPFADSSPADEQMHTAVASAKLNLGLHVLARRADGFHALATVMLPLAWADRLTAATATTLAAPTSRFALTCSDPDLPTCGDNLVVQAAEALAAWAGDAPGVHLHLDKRVPYGAGLGGGSSDAAAALRLLADLWALDVPRDAMHALAAGLGSDVPFFLDAVPALATGRGEILTPLLGADGQPYRMPFWLTVAVPPVHVSTAEAYRLVTPDDRDRPDLATLVATNDPERWQRELVNDFQTPVEAVHPAIGALRRRLERAGAAYASLSGSGSAVFGVFETEAAARAAADDAKADGVRVWTERPAEA